MIRIGVWIRFECLTAYEMNEIFGMQLAFRLPFCFSFNFCAFFDQPIGR